ncbi:hypothetical protein [Rhodopseudomonas sp. BR0M22]|uniref:hypothetical protein n=1 Tax=Rhodopseudomonas sp. BR0M22 TaxID=2269369 RepID=UPI0013E06D5A|nr:hypothetical protein [Rhodopseudomonas sp. BR0M22]NEW93034.1 hypothetical protein [Rhodopseudomonas sp. BR0M22]
MAEGEDSNVSRHKFSIAYTGKSRESDHSIDVQVLAPALLAFGKLLREANSEFNSKKSTAKVLVVSDFEHKCFNINFELVVSLYEQLKTLLGTETASSAKNILEWIGIIGGPAATGTFTYLRYLKWRRGRKVTSATPLVDSDKTGVVEVKIEGDGNAVHVHNHVYKLSENAKALRATRDAFLPLGHDGFEAVQIREDDLVVDEISADEVGDIVASCNIGIEKSKETEPEIEETPAWLSVYSPVYDQSAPNWRFRLGKEVIYADISATSIARDALDRGGALVDDAYQVRLQIITDIDAQGNKKQPEYKVLQVIRFVPASPAQQQTTLFDKP